ncbi:MAG: hypothetical protein KKA07_15205 [Bacteroidetes bacterium]|nr:hypothetical protein [Bacteroidota bacterium]MBU1720409.1 hypothetical protein [Bacteroidota bacterium]
MKPNQLLTILFVFLSTMAFSHEEPAKTIKDKQEKEKNRLFILQHKIKSSTIIKYEVSDGKVNQDRKEKFYTVEYDQNGNISKMYVYKTGDTLDYKIGFSYDSQNNMLADTDFSPDDSIIEQIEYKYGDDNCVVSQENFSVNRQLDSRFFYTKDQTKNELTITKIKPSDSIEYILIYSYSGAIETGNNTGIIKQSTDGKLIMRVENIFNPQGQRTEKLIFDENNKLMYSFRYEHDSNDNMILIEKVSSENKILTKTAYRYNTDQTESGIETTNDSGTIISSLKFEYTYF